MDPITVAAAVTPFLLKAVQGLGDKIWEKASDAAADEAAGSGGGCSRNRKGVVLGEQ